MTKIKICGLKTIEDIEVINKYKPDYAGFILAESKRRVSFDKLQELIKNLDANIIPVGVFVNESIERVVEGITIGIKVIQLHGDEDQKYIEELIKNIQNISIWKAIRVETTEGNVIEGLNRGTERSNSGYCRIVLPRAEISSGNDAYKKESSEENVAVAKIHGRIDAYLLDKYSKGIYGGTGEKFCWDMFAGFVFQKPIILAGGLDDDNVLEGIKIFRPFCVDVSSGVEENGRKSEEKVKTFIDKVRKQ